MWRIVVKGGSCPTIGRADLVSLLVRGGGRAPGGRGEARGDAMGRAGRGAGRGGRGNRALVTMKPAFAAGGKVPPPPGSYGGPQPPQQQMGDS